MRHPTIALLLQITSFIYLAAVIIWRGMRIDELEAELYGDDDDNTASVTDTHTIHTSEV